MFLEALDRRDDVGVEPRRLGGMCRPADNLRPPAACAARQSDGCDWSGRARLSAEPTAIPTATARSARPTPSAAPDIPGAPGARGRESSTARRRRPSPVPRRDRASDAARSSVDRSRWDRGGRWRRAIPTAAPRQSVGCRGLRSRQGRVVGHPSRRWRQRPSRPRRARCSVSRLRPCSSARRRSSIALVARVGAALSVVPCRLVVPSGVERRDLRPHLLRRLLWGRHRGRDGGRVDAWCWRPLFARRARNQANKYRQNHE